MRKLNEKATVIFLKIIDGVNWLGDKKRIGIADDMPLFSQELPYMPLIVECIDERTQGKVYSLAHYGLQNGDMMRDPEMTFLVVDKAIFAMSYRNDYVGQDLVAVRLGDGANVRFCKVKQWEMSYFAQEWLENIFLQQHL